MRIRLLDANNSGGPGESSLQEGQNPAADSEMILRESLVGAYPDGQP